LTGIIICDKCGKPFLAHGNRDVIAHNPKIAFLKVIPNFKGIRRIRRITTTSEFTKTYSKFFDVCENCAND